MQKVLRAIQPYLMAATVFSIPSSVSIKSIVLPLCLLVNIACIQDWTQVKQIMKHPVVVTAYLFLAWCLLSTLWAPANWPETSSVTSKMLKFIYLPFLALGFIETKSRYYSKIAFLIAMSLTAAISLSMAMTGYYWTGTADVGAVFNDRIMTGLFISIGTWLAADMALTTKGKLRWFFGIVFALCSMQIFIANTSRTGYVIYALLAFCFCLLHFNFRQTLALLLSLMAVATFAYFVNPQLAHNVNMTVYNIVHLEQVANQTSIGYRFGFHRFAEKLFWQHPVFGTGSGSFSWYYHLEQPMPFYSTRLFEPHSQYWLTMVEQGAIGLALLVGWLALIVKTMFGVRQIRSFLFFVVAAVTASSFADSMILYSATGYLLIAVTAAAIGEHIALGAVRKERPCQNDMVMSSTVPT